MIVSTCFWTLSLTELQARHQCWSLFFKKSCSRCSFIKKETPLQVFSCECSKILRTSFYKKPPSDCSIVITWLRLLFETPNFWVVLSFNFPMLIYWSFSSRCLFLSYLLNDYDHTNTFWLLHSLYLYFLIEQVAT